MISILQKEIRSFLSSLIAYVVIIVFLIATGLFMWVLPDNNVFDMAYANLDTLFTLAPWLFLFLISAITMRTFSEEKKNGTIEILTTKPISDLKIILAKYFAGVVLVLFALIPSLIYFYTVYQLGAPTGNMDVGATWGSYIGLFFLASCFVSIGLRCATACARYLIPIGWQRHTWNASHRVTINHQPTFVVFQVDVFTTGTGQRNGWQSQARQMACASVINWIRELIGDL